MIARPHEPSLADSAPAAGPGISAERDMRQHKKPRRPEQLDLWPGGLPQSMWRSGELQEPPQAALEGKEAPSRDRAG